MSAKRKSRYISRRDAALQLVFLKQFYIVITDHISKSASNVLQLVGNNLHGKVL